MKLCKVKRDPRGSLTVEAALVMPLFIYAIIAFLYFLQIISIQEKLQNAITETGYYAGKYAYVYDYLLHYEKGSQEMSESQGSGNTGGENSKTEDSKTEDFKTGNPKEGELNGGNSKEEGGAEGLVARAIDSAFYKSKMGEYLDTEELDHSCIRNGFSGIHTFLSTFMEEEDSIDIILVYNIKLPLLFFSVKDLQMVQRVRMRGWNGHRVAAKDSGGDALEETGEEEEIVYITETGTVYHRTRDCTHLKLSIQAVDFKQAEDLRNVNGGKYYRCPLCCGTDDLEGKTVYITDTGDRYHESLDCSGLKRTIIAIPISQVGTRTPCKRCGK